MISYPASHVDARVVRRATREGVLCTRDAHAHTDDAYGKDEHTN
jgi:hypothetical protein